MLISGALHLARRADPKGLRTMGVITKLDLLDKDIDASLLLLGDKIPLRLGYTGPRQRILRG